MNKSLSHSSASNKSLLNIRPQRMWSPSKHHIITRLRQLISRNKFGNQTSEELPAHVFPRKHPPIRYLITNQLKQSRDKSKTKDPTPNANGELHIIIRAQPNTLDHPNGEKFQVTSRDHHFRSLIVLFHAHIYRSTQSNMGLFLLQTYHSSNNKLGQLCIQTQPCVNS